MAVMVFAAFWACYHSSFCCVPWFSKFLAAFHIIFVPSFPSGQGWAGELGKDGGERTQPLAVSHPWAVKLQRPLFLAAARKALALLSSPSCCFFINTIWPHLWTVPLAWLNPHHPTSQFWVAPHCCFSTCSLSAPCFALPKHQALLWEQWDRKEQSFQDLSPSSVLQQPGWAASISPTERDAEPQNHGRRLKIEVSSAWGTQ